MSRGEICYSELRQLSRNENFFDSHCEFHSQKTLKDTNQAKPGSNHIETTELERDQFDSR